VPGYSNGGGISSERIQFFPRSLVCVCSTTVEKMASVEDRIRN